MKKNFFTFFLLFSLVFLYIYQYRNPLQVSFDIKIIEAKTFHGQLYYSNTKDLYKTIRLKNITYKVLKDQFQHVNVVISELDNIKSLRFDPLLSEGKVEIRNFLVFKNGNSYTINLQKATKNNKHNIKIIEAKKNSLLLKATGVDPYIELDKDIRLSSFLSLKFVGLVLFVSLFLFVLMQVLYRYSFAKELMLIGMVFIYSVHVIFVPKPEIATMLLELFAFLSFYMSLSNIGEKKNYLQWFVIFVGLYFLLSYMSLYVGKNPHEKYLYDTFGYIVLAGIIPIGFYKIKDFHKDLIRYSFVVVLLFMLVCMYLINTKNLVISNQTFFDIELWFSNWTQKNYMFWYVLLLWGTISFFNPKKIKELLIIFVLIFLSWYVLKNGYSKSTMIALYSGSVLYIVLSLFQFNKKVLFVFINLFTLYIIFSPILFSLVDLTPYHHRLILRDAIYHTSATLIKEHWLFGYGFGGTLDLHLSDFVDKINYPSHYIDTFPGGHPHNLSLLFWLEFGIVGAIFLAYFIHKLLKVFIENSYKKPNHAGLFAMIVSMDIITSFSWSIWYPQVLLTYSFFIALLVLSFSNI